MSAKRKDGRKPSLGLLLATAKGLETLRVCLDRTTEVKIEYVVIAKNSKVTNDYSVDIEYLAKENGIKVHFLGKGELPDVDWKIAVSWRHMIAEFENLIVFHDSLLPKYRGFAPLVSSLINGEKLIGVTSLFASASFDRGAIIGQFAKEVQYPITIAEAICQIEECYRDAMNHAIDCITLGKLSAKPQVESEASYSLWLDEDDYMIDWNWDATKIRRFVDAVGTPYAGATTSIGSELYLVEQVEEMSDVIIENRMPGKVLFIEDDCPVVVCGTGLIKIRRLQNKATKSPYLPLPTFRTKFH